METGQPSDIRLLQADVQLRRLLKLYDLLGGPQDIGVHGRHDLRLFTPLADGLGGGGIHEFLDVAEVLIIRVADGEITTI